MLSIVSSMKQLWKLHSNSFAVIQDFSIFHIFIFPLHMYMCWSEFCTHSYTQGISKYGQYLCQSVGSKCRSIVKSKMDHSIFTLKFSYSYSYLHGKEPLIPSHHKTIIQLIEENVCHVGWR